MTLAFALVMAVVLAATGGFLYLRLGSELTGAVDQGLRARAADVAALVKQADSGLAEAGRSPLTDRGESIAQILSRSGKVLDAPPPLRHRQLLTAPERARAAAGTIVISHSLADGSATRLLATPVHAQGRRLIVLVGASLEGRQEALTNLRGLLLLGGPIALLLASAAGYGVAAGALRPVESMRRRAARIQAGAPGERLPVPPARDEVGRLGATLNEMLERLEAAFERERTFVSDASHELRTPLSILRGELELALRSGRTIDEVRDALASAVEETDRLSQLAQDLLVIARADQGLPIHSAPTRAAELLDAVRTRYARRAEERGATVTLHAGPELTLVADRVRLEQALGNLLDNALRYGGGTIELSAAAGDPDCVRLAVTDDGAGFPADFLDRAFERFARADPARGRGGSGLGLAIVAAVANAHGGRACARNLEGGGCEITLELPRAAATASP